MVDTQYSIRSNQDVSSRVTAKPSVCVLCSHNCGIILDVEDNKITKVRPDKNNVVTQGYVCNKATSVVHYVDHKQRVKTPLKRQSDGSYREIEWAQAISEIGAKLRDLREQHTGETLGLIGVGGQANHLDGFYALAFFTAFGGKRWYNAFAQEKTQHFLISDLMMKANPSKFFHTDSENSDLVLMIGTNPWLSNRGEKATKLLNHLQKDDGKTLVVVDPRRTETADKADAFLQVSPSGDAYLLMAMAKIIIEEKLHDEAFLQERTIDLDQISATLQGISLKELIDLTGLAQADVRKLAQDYATAESASIFIDLGAEQGIYSTLVSYLIYLLSALTNNICRKGGNLFLPMFSPNLPGGDILPQVKAVASDIESIRALGPYGMFSTALIAEDIVNNHPNRLRALIVEGANPMGTAADTNQLDKALDQLELLVVIDPAMTETAQKAHYVLPTPVGYEKWEYSSFPKAVDKTYVQLRRPAVPAPEQALQESEIYAALAEEVGLVSEPSTIMKQLAKGARTDLGAAAYLAALTGSAALTSIGTTSLLAKTVFTLYRTLGEHLPAPALAAHYLQCHLYAMFNRAEIRRAHPDIGAFALPTSIGNMLFDKSLSEEHGFIAGQLNIDNQLDDVIGYSDKKIRLAPAEMVAEIKRAMREKLPTNKDYPLVLNAGRRTRYNANTIQRDPKWRKGGKAFVALHPDDAAQAGIADGDWVRVSSEAGSVEVAAMIDETMKRGSISMPHGFGLNYPDENGKLVVDGANTNVLSPAHMRDPFSGNPYHKYVLCKVEVLRATAGAAP